MGAVPDSSTWVPETRYARNGDVHIAYQAFGEGEVTFVGLPGIVSNVEVGWEEPELRRYLTRLGTAMRFVTYDKRGQGLSDRESGVRRSTTDSTISRRCSARSAPPASRSAGSLRAGRVAGRVASLAGSGELLASRTVKDLVAGSGYSFASRGVHCLKGVPDEW